MPTAKSSIEQLKIDKSKRTEGRKPLYKVSVFAIIIALTLVGYMVLSSHKVIPKSHAVQQEQSMQVSHKAEALTITPANTFSETTNTIGGQEAILDASGHIVARRVATVSSRVTGKLESLLIEEGQQVKQNQVLAKVDNVQATLAYQRAQANLANGKANYQELIVLKEHEQRRLTRQQTLNKNQLISQQLTENSEMRINQLLAQIDQAKAFIDLHQSNVALAKYELAQHQIRAPFDGVVISKNAQVGELISAGMSGGSIRTGVGTIVDMDSLEIEVEVSESYINRVKPNQPVIAKLDAYPQWAIPSEVIAVIPTADRQKASIKVRIKLLEIDHRILPDMSVRVSFLSTQGDSLVAANKKGQ